MRPNYIVIQENIYPKQNTTKSHPRVHASLNILDLPELILVVWGAVSSLRLVHESGVWFNILFSYFMVKS